MNMIIICGILLIPDTFTDFLSIYHEGKWDFNGWDCIDVYLKFKGLSTRPYLVIDLSSEYDLSNDEKCVFKKYLTYQWHQLMRGKDEIRCAYFLYLENTPRN